MTTNQPTATTASKLVWEAISAIANEHKLSGADALAAITAAAAAINAEFGPVV